MALCQIGGVVKTRTKKILGQNNQTYKTASGAWLGEESSQGKSLYANSQRPKVRLCVNDSFNR